MHLVQSNRRPRSRAKLSRQALLGPALIAIVMSFGCATSVAPPDRAPSTPQVQLPALDAMGLRQKAAQMIMVRAYGQHRNPDSLEHRKLLSSVTELGVGGVVLFDSDLESIPRLLDTLQESAQIPLLVAADLESGLAFRVRRGASRLPSAMAIGATRSFEAARLAGEITGREALAVGVHWVLAPVADVNNNPSNPVINIRSFGEDPDLVSGMAAAFIKGARSTGVLTTAKHFPGHGDTTEDSHYALPVISAGRDRLERVELAPFRSAIAAGVDSIMTGHLSVPALDPTGVPASLSERITGDLLRRELGFEGLIVTDAMEMKGAGVLWSGGAVVQAIRAGADIVLLPADERIAIQSIVRAVEEGQLEEARLDQSIRRIFRAKQAAFSRDRGNGGDRWREIARPTDLERIRAMTASAVTLVRNQDGLLPLEANQPLRLLHVVLKDAPWRGPLHRVAAAALTRRVAETEQREIGPVVTPEEIDDIVASAAAATHVVISAYVRRGGEGPDAGLSASQIELIEKLQIAGSSPILLSFGSPYLLSQVPGIATYGCSYGVHEMTQETTIAAIFGETAIGGKLPVSLPGIYDHGHGVELPAYAMTLRRARPEEAGFRPGAMDEVDRIIDGFIADGAFPGAVVAVGHRGVLAHLQAFGNLTYATDAPAVTTETLYDLASLTKVVATTTVAMTLVGQERLDLDAPVQDFLPLFAGEGKEKVTVRHLLTHSSGIDWWAPLYQEVQGKAAYLERIQVMPLVNKPGSKTVYSDLGLILLGEILERVAGAPLDTLASERVFDPLGMKDTLYNPGPELLARVAPTEEDPAWRGRLVHGEVHDENAFALGGVAPHAGLFGTAEDLARLAQMILNGGVFEHRRIVPRATLAEFTRLAGLPDSTRALGWDTKSPEGSSAGTLFSPNSFGHTGFTGTSIWIDPERELFLILLTNRVHPTRDNKLIRKVRPAVADAVVRGLAD